MNIPITIELSANGVRRYREQRCRMCPTMVQVPPWFKPYADYCDECRIEVVEKFAGLDFEPETTEEDEQL